MKTKIFSLLACATLMLAASCEPAENRYELKNSFDPNEKLDLSFEYADGVDGSNYITVKMNTPGVMGYWDYNIGTKYSDEATFIYPATGTATFTYHVINTVVQEDGSFERGFSQTMEVDVNELSVPLAEQYYCLVGRELEGKTWEFAGKAGSGELFWFMCPSNNASSYMGVWWNAGDGGVPDGDGTLTFDLNGGANMTYSASGDAAADGVLGKFVFSPDFAKFSTPGAATILGAHPQGQEAAITEFVVCELTDDRLALYCNKAAGGTGWTWVFKPVEK